MKLKYFFPIFIATAAVFASCNDDDDATYLSEVRVSSSYMALPVDGGSDTITVDTRMKWEVDTIGTFIKTTPWFDYKIIEVKDSLPKLVLTAPATLDGRTTSFYINIKDDDNQVVARQTINVIQGLPTVEDATCADVIAGPDSKTYRVKGTVTAIANTTYGNWYLNDGTGEIYIYGTLDAQGQTKNFESLGLEVGDIVTVQGPKLTYGSVVELVDVSVITIEKSLIKVDSLSIAGETIDEAVLPVEGGDVTAHLTCKGNGIYAEIPEDAQSWLSIKSINGNNVVFHAAANNSGPRTTTLVFKTTDGQKEYTAETTISQEGSAGTLELPMTPEEAIVAANAGVTSAVYVKGIVSKVLSGGYGEQYGNASFWISADGTYNEDLSLDFEVYQANWLGGNSWTAGNAQIEEGAEVIVYGPLTIYKGTAETQGKGAAHVYSVNGVTTDENGIGTLNAPFNVSGGIAAAQAGIKSSVYVQGIVSELYKGGFDPAYGNGSFYISADGVRHNDNSLDFEAYQVTWLGGQTWVEGTHPQIAVGDNVIIYGPVTVYNGTCETQGKGVAYVYSYNGVTE